MHRELVERRAWIGEAAFLRALNFCVLLPGPEAQQLATLIGWRFHGTLGGVVAGALFVLPSIVVLLALSYAVAAYGDVSVVSGLLAGVRPVVVALVVDALLRIGRRTLRHPVLIAIAAGAYLALQVLAVPFPLVVVLAGAVAIALRDAVPAAFAAAGHDAPGAVADPRPGAHARRAALIVGAFLVLWIAPVAALVLAVGPGDVLVHEALFFTQAAFVTFGGAYAVLAYIAHAAVIDFGWLSDEQMVQGLGLAESTPGPLIMVTQYVGSLAAWKLHPEAPLPFLVLGGLVTTYMTFLPSFFLILLAAPYVDRVATLAGVRAALTGVTAAVVGVIGYLATFFGTAVLFEGGRIEPFAAVMAAISFAALRRTRAPVPIVVALGALVGLLWRLRPV